MIGTGLLALVLALTATLAAACGGKGHKPSIASASGARGASASPTPSVDATEQMRQFAQCMRDHGVDVPDPGTDSGGGAVRITTSDGTKTEQAMQACQQFMPAGKLQTPSAEDMEKLRQYAQCMRDHGIDMPDPDPNGGNLKITKGPGSGPDKFNPDDPAFKAADDACASKLPGKRQIGTGGGK
jgi:hypothetical protein